VELIFTKIQKSKIDAGKAKKKIEEVLETAKKFFNCKILSVTSTPKYFIVLISFPDTYSLKEVDVYTDIVGGVVVYALNGGVRFRTYEIHSVTSSLLFKKEWREVKIALCVIAKDEAPYVDSFMRKIQGFFDDIVVGVDPRTKDSTWDEFANRGARCFYIYWEDDFGKFRNLTMEFVAPNIDWVFWLDVDEYAEPELLLNLRNMIKMDYDAFSFKRINLVTKTEERVVRLFKRSKGRWKGKVHEVVTGISEERICHTNFKIYHYQRWIRKEGIDKLRRNLFYRRLEKPDFKGVISFDIDGTLEEYGGEVPISILNELKNSGYLVGLVSGRSDSREIADRLGLDFGVTGKKGALETLGEIFSGDLKIHVDDDRYVKELCDKYGWRYVYPSKFYSKGYRTYLSF